MSWMGPGGYPPGPPGMYGGGGHHHFHHQHHNHFGGPGDRGDRCLFFVKMGACRHGDKCTKLHLRPPISQTLLIPMMYLNPKVVPLQCADENGNTINIEYDKKFIKRHVSDFYEEVFQMMMEHGRVLEMYIVDNICEHLLGNVYVKFETDKGAEAAFNAINNHAYNEVLLMPEFSPVVEFGDAVCKEDREGECKRGLMCNYLHIIKISSKLVKHLFAKQDELYGPLKEPEAPQAPPPMSGGGAPHHHPGGMMDPSMMGGMGMPPMGPGGIMGFPPGGPPGMGMMPFPPPGGMPPPGVMGGRPPVPVASSGAPGPAPTEGSSSNAVRDQRDRDDRGRDRGDDRGDRRDRGGEDRHRKRSRSRNSRDRDRSRDRHRRSSRDRDRDRRRRSSRDAPPAADPPRDPRRDHPASTSRVPAASQCHICGEIGHISRDCPMKKVAS